MCFKMKLQIGLNYTVFSNDFMIAAEGWHDPFDFHFSWDFGQKRIHKWSLTH